MKKIIVLLGYIFLALLVTMAIVFCVLLLYGKKLDRESKAFADTAITAITTNWDVEELKKRASPELENEVDFDEIQEYMASLETLGKFESFEGSIGQATITLSPQFGYEVTADYKGTVNFEEGFAEIQILLIRQEGQWQILDFRVTPQMFTEDKNII